MGVSWCCLNSAKKSSILEGSKVNKQGVGKKWGMYNFNGGGIVIGASRISTRENRSYRDGGSYEHIPNLHSNNLLINLSQLTNSSLR